MVLPWSTCPIVPILTWGFFLSNLPRAARIVKEGERLTVAEEEEVKVRGRREEGFKKEEESLVIEEGLEEKGEGEGCGKASLEEVEVGAEAKEMAAIEERGIRERNCGRREWIDLKE